MNESRANETRAVFVLTLFVNLIARFYVLRAERGGRVTRTVAPGMGE